MSANAGKMLAIASTIIENNGLAKGTYFRGPNNRDLFNVDKDYVDPSTLAMRFHDEGYRPKCCVMGAIYLAGAQCRADYEDLQRAFNKLADSLDESSSWNLPDWNDKRSRTRAQVVAALRKAAGSDWSALYE